MGAMKRILAAVDKSSHAHSVISRAVELTCLLQSDLTILSVIRSDPVAKISIGDEHNQFANFHRELIFKHFPPDTIVM